MVGDIQQIMTRINAVLRRLASFDNDLPFTSKDIKSVAQPKPK